MAHATTNRYFCNEGEPTFYSKTHSSLWKQCLQKISHKTSFTLCWMQWWLTFALNCWESKEGSRLTCCIRRPGGAHSPLRRVLYHCQLLVSWNINRWRKTFFFYDFKLSFLFLCQEVHGSIWKAGVTWNIFMAHLVDKLNVLSSQGNSTSHFQLLLHISLWFLCLWSFCVTL